MTAVMLETVRKGMWKASPEQVAALARLHTETVKDFGAACSGFVCDNAKLRDFISSKVSSAAAAAYNRAVAGARAEQIAADDNGKVMKREELNRTETETHRINGMVVAAVVVVAVIGLAVLIRRRRKNTAA